MGSTQLYHYTSSWKAKDIRRDGKIKMTNNRVILTNMRPEDHNRNEILVRIYGNNVPTDCKNMADNVVLIDASKLNMSKMTLTRANIFTYIGDIPVNPRDVIDKPGCTKGGNGSGGQVVYYHYTNSKTGQKIKASGRISVTDGQVILTTLKPEHHFRDELLKIIYGKFDGNQVGNMADWCVVVRVSSLDSTKLKPSPNSRDVYHYSGDIVVKQSDVTDKPKCTKSTDDSIWSKTNDDKYLYHYTDIESAQEIKRSGYLKLSPASRAFGPGVYMNDLKPTDFFRDDIVKNNFGGIAEDFPNKADWVVRVDKNRLDMNKLKRVSDNVTNDSNRRIFVYPDEIQVKSSDVILKPVCHRGL